jgi:hypothetical protein
VPRYENWIDFGLVAIAYTVSYRICWNGPTANHRKSETRAKYQSTSLAAINYHLKLPEFESSYKAEIYESVTGELLGKSTTYSAFIVGSDSDKQLAKIGLLKWDSGLNLIPN